MLSKLIFTVAIVLAVIGAVVALGERYPNFRLGRLPGDIVIEREGLTVFIPITSMLLIGLLLSAGFGLLRLFKR